MNCSIPKSFSRLLRSGALLQVCVFAAWWLMTLRPAHGQSVYTPPPRTVEDILAVLDQYKPDPTVAEKARAAASRQPPATANKADLAKFYLERSYAARDIGLGDGGR